MSKPTCTTHAMMDHLVLTDIVELALAAACFAVRKALAVVARARRGVNPRRAVRERYANRSEVERARDREAQQRRYSATPEGKAKRREAQRQRRANRSDKPK